MFLIKYIQIQCTYKSARIFFRTLLIDWPIENKGSICWDQCGPLAGPCAFCGSGLCCKMGESQPGTDCDGSRGGNGEYNCVDNPGGKMARDSKMQIDG